MMNRVIELKDKIGSKRLKVITGFVVSLILLHLVYSVSIYSVHKNYLEQIKTQVVKRVALDLPTIPLEKEWMNEIGNPEEVDEYVKHLNDYISEQGWPYNVKQITNYQPNDDEHYEMLTIVGQDVYVVFTENKALDGHGFNPLTVLFALLFTGVVYIRQEAKEAVNIVPEAVLKSPLLLSIDLKNKTIVNPKTQKVTELSNKPLCFYCALIEYCLDNPECRLSSNQPLPEAFLMLAQKYFYRLIELGHTIRKRPNFENNLDKTLSEIRAALEEVLENDITAKEVMVPPKAIGEGSRSKVHSFCLNNLKAEFIEIKGK